MRAGRLLLLTTLTAVTIAGAALVAAAVWRDAIMTEAGLFLTADTMPAKSDLLVVLRGDETSFERAAAAADFFQQGFASYLYVSSALSDLPSVSLQARGVQVSSPQERIASVLMQRGVPCARILLDRSSPGGGTAAEFKRIDATLHARGMSSVLIVTSWFHMRRTRAIARGMFEMEGLSATVVAAPSTRSPHNWWHYRYLAILVLEEYAKLLLRFFPKPFEFSDDPPTASTFGPQLQSPSPCAASENHGAVTMHAR